MILRDFKELFEDKQSKFIFQNVIKNIDIEILLASKAFYLSY